MGEKVSGNRYTHIKLCSPGKIQTGILKKKNIEIPTSWSTLLQQRAISSYCNRVLCHCHDGSETLLRGREWKDCTTFNNNRHFFAFQVQTLSYLVHDDRTQLNIDRSTWNDVFALPPTHVSANEVIKKIAAIRKAC